MKLSIAFFQLLLIPIIVTACSMDSAKRIPLGHDLAPLSLETDAYADVKLDAPIWLWDERLRYRLLYKDPTAVRHYHWDRWQAPLPALLEQRWRGLGKAGLSLHFELRRFEQRFESADRSHVIMTIRIQVRDHHGRRTQRIFDWRQPTATPDAAGAIAAYMELLERAERDIEDWLRHRDSEAL
ncbi:MAG: hypothetical protein CVV06_00220 [Gammaproteobacteria bacterium HGW-Gammaproteobacteria-10]|nr:MAG: hypothetical protein CVV06_00220 [Gammaproteobacteria bacterium HGW-Gammaproteobacteria-10]